MAQRRLYFNPQTPLYLLFTFAIQGCRKETVLDAGCIVLAMIKIRSKRILFLFAAFLLIAAFGLALVHCHDHNEHPTQECSICRLIKFLSVILGTTLLLAGVTRPRNYLPPLFQLKPAFLTLPVQSGRAPPF